MNENQTRRLAAIMFTDIVGYTALMQRSEREAMHLRTHHRRVFQELHKNYHGEILQYFGDGTLSIFASGIEAVECAIEIQKLLQQDDPVPLRVGLHIGDIVYDGVEIYGDSVNLASRIENMGEPGAILLSGKLNDELKNHQHISTTSMGHYELKNIQQPVEIFAVANEGIPLPKEIRKKSKKNKAQNTIAVLPLINMSSSEENEYFSDGMTEEIINAMAKIDKLKVTSRTSSFFFKNKKIAIKEIGKELNVSTILEGSIRIAGNMIRVTAQLINVEDDYHFWSETWDRKMDDVFAIQDEISLLIAEKLREHLGHFKIKDRLIAPQTENFNAYDNYLKGNYHYMKWNPKDIKLAIDYYEKALKLDDSHAESYIAASNCYIFLASTGYLPPQENFIKAKEYIDIAREINDQLPEIYFALGGLSFWYEWDFEKAHDYLFQTLKINPNHAQAHESMAILLLLTGHKSQALKHINYAIHLDPLAPNHRVMEAWIHYMNGNYKKSVKLCDLALEREPKSVPCHIIKGTSLIFLNRAQEVIDYYEDNPNPVIDISTVYGMQAIAHIYNKNKTKSEYLLKLLRGQTNESHAERAFAFISIVQSMAGNFDEALAIIEKGVQNKIPLLLFLMKDPLLDNLRNIPRYQKIMNSIFREMTEIKVNKYFGSKDKGFKKPLLNKMANDSFADRLLKVMQEKKPFLENDLSLKKLATFIGIHPNQLSWLLNAYFEKSFNDFINHYRTAHFKELALDPKNGHITLMGLAYQSGFNSKTVFNTYFKKETGMTPSAFLKQAAV